MEGGDHYSDGHTDTPAVGEARPWEQDPPGKVPFTLVKWVLLGAPLILPNNVALLEAAMFLMMSPQNHS